jgi:hypothetical protein
MVYSSPRVGSTRDSDHPLPLHRNGFRLEDAIEAVQSGFFRVGSGNLRSARSRGPSHRPSGQGAAVVAVQ